MKHELDYKSANKKPKNERLPFWLTWLIGAGILLAILILAVAYAVYTGSVPQMP